MLERISRTSAVVVLFILINLSFPSLVFACTYESTITENHLDFKITSDIDHIQFVQLMYKNDALHAPYVVTKLYAPTSFPWTQYSDGYQTYSGYSMVIQNRHQMADAAYWVSWINSEEYLHIPAGVYGLDFTGTMDYPDISLEYGTMDDNGVVGGIGEPWTFCTRTGQVSTSTPTPTPTISPSPSPTETPTPTPTSTPTATPTPTTIPVSKVVFLPGAGASWNADAILNCKTSGYSGDWTLAPYAEDVYKNLLTALSSSNWNTKPFYYDWRSDVRNNAGLLSNFVNANSGVGEKVDLVGHSMGGLISRAYIESEHGTKVDSFISAGSPYGGDALAYPVWSNGDVWDDNFVTKIATTLFLKRCGGLNLSDRQVVQNKIPSIQNLLPTYDYLRNSKTNQLKPVTDMNAKNNWLPTNFDSPFWGVRVGTLSGTGFPTLKIIKVNDPSRRDVQLGNWLDGKPTGQEKVNQGDGTVLTTNSQLVGANNQVIGQNHTGLVASSEGMAKILSFLGTPPPHAFRFISPVLAHDKPNNTIYSEPNSSLVIIGYPGNFWVTDKDGKVTHDTNGMIAFTNPTSGNYQLDIVPQSNDTLFIVTQFLSNGQTLYKEYHFKNLQPKTKVIEFDSKKPKEDILKDKNDYKKPPQFDNWWWYFWRLPFKH